jgi:hypothetical protein
MAHNIHTKAQAMALLALGNAPQHVADQLGLPYTTVKRWQGETFATLRQIIGPIDLKVFDFSQQNGHKKKGS